MKGIDPMFQPRWPAGLKCAIAADPLFARDMLAIYKGPFSLAFMTWPRWTEGEGHATSST